MDRVIVAMQATERLVSQKSFYVEISRARDEAVLLTNDPDQLSKTGERQTTLDAWMDGRLAGPLSAAPEPKPSREADQKHENQPEKQPTPERNEKTQLDLFKDDDRFKGRCHINHFRLLDPRFESSRC